MAGVYIYQFFNEVNMLQKIVKLLYLPLFLIVGNGAAIYLVENSYSKLWLFVLMSGVIALSFIIEKWMPYEDQRAHLNENLRF